MSPFNLSHRMKDYKNTKLLTFLLLVAFHCGYMEWGRDKHYFIYQVELEIFVKAATNIQQVLHPFTLIPFAGIILLIITLFQLNPNRKLTIIGVLSLSTLIVLLFIISLLGLNIKMLLSTLPFILIATAILFKKKPAPNY